MWSPVTTNKFTGPPGVRAEFGKSHHHSWCCQWHWIRATALKLASLGATLALCDISEHGLSGVMTELASEIEHRSYTFSVGSSADCNEAVASIVSDLGRIDFLFNCAGINPTTLAITETTDEYFDKLVNTNLRGPYNMTRTCVPHLKSGAAIVNVASISGSRATSGWSIYCATKFGIIGFTKAMALELGPKGIRVNYVAPGIIDTPTMAGNVAGGDANDKLVQDIALGRLGQPEEVAEVVVNLFGSTFMKGSMVEVHGRIG
ncbi:Uu.00g059140.m01.CDS01 [Anthostomella pinea]|uniref:Uu.00g059140.m01.CDS01 n=1 Tax=Anthostomella pinea TaxID=933095 RepID=A0AAI8VSN3_9PEZI|nr:Uu.00g059140.m01.CDS01 [Anthostomella pinea]